MKKIIIIISFICSVVSLYAQNDAFEKLTEIKGANVVYISRSMLQMMPSMNMNASGINIGDVVGKLNSITVLSVETPNSVKAMKSGINNILKSDSGYEQTMVVKDEDSKTVFYSKNIKIKDNNISEVLMVVEEDSEMSIIRIIGNISASDLQKITNHSSTPQYTKNKEKTIGTREQALKEAEKARKEAAKAREEVARAKEEVAKAKEEVAKAKEQVIKAKEQAIKEITKNK